MMPMVDNIFLVIKERPPNDFGIMMKDARESHLGQRLQIYAKRAGFLIIKNLFSDKDWAMIERILP